MVRYVHQLLCDKANVEGSEQWYGHRYERIMENKNYTIGNFNMQCDQLMVDIVLIHQYAVEGKTIDVSIPGDSVKRQNILRNTS